ncbi:EpsD family peptidyl-prolyl cis-trans isomerase [Sphaerotilus hippei]|uniref:EpsD family peptidyl-prolyl cis-trans isomerase n=1 Tax=Sphaerotilus hippei TaxID=744406 RepID=A0A318H9C3_9BURK|nr:EpsD family peptidyl-prolyl cis-trans isomerase [Sphaerotilus hippei]
MMSVSSQGGVARARQVNLSSSLRLVRGLGLVAAAVALVACGGGKEGGATQVAAKVNKEEISVHQINFVLQRQPNLKPEQAQAASKRVLEGLVDQELAVQQAVEQKLDRDPRTVMAIEAARREILSRAYMDKLTGGVEKPTDAEISQFYASRPALFSQRRVYSLVEFNIEAGGDKAQKEALAAQFNGVKGADALAAQLRAAGVKFAARPSTVPAESVPTALLGKLSTMGEGQAMSNVTPVGINVLVLNAAKSAPVSEAQAKAAITSFLVNDKKRKLAVDEMKRLREAAKIEYLGQFSGGVASANVSASAAEEPASLLPAAAAASEALDATDLQKGLSGLK